MILWNGYSNYPFDYRVSVQSTTKVDPPSLLLNTTIWIDFDLPK